MEYFEAFLDTGCFYNLLIIYNTVYTRLTLVNNDLADSYWLPKKLFIRAATPIMLDMDADTAMEQIESEAFPPESFDLIILASNAEIYRSKDKNYILEMFDDQVEVTEKNWVGQDDNEIIEQYAEMGFETWDDIVRLEVSDTTEKISFFEIQVSEIE